MYLGLGSNLGDRRSNLRRALRQLRPAGRITQVSSLYETEPVGYLRQPRFLNAVCVIETGLSPHALLRFIKRIEQQMGRRSTRRFGPRLIDLDILIYGAYCVRTRTLEVPHPRFHERAFTLVPLREVAPGLAHPVLGRTIAALAAELVGQPGVEASEGPGWADLSPDE